MRPLWTHKRVHKARGAHPDSKSRNSQPGPVPSRLEETEARLGGGSCPRYLLTSTSGRRPATAATLASKVRKACAPSALGESRRPPRCRHGLSQAAAPPARHDGCSPFPRGAGSSSAAQPVRSWSRAIASDPNPPPASSPSAISNFRGRPPGPVMR